MAEKHTKAQAVLASVKTLVAEFDPATMLARDAAELVSVFGEIEHLGAAGKALAARKVADTELWRRKGFKSAAAWLASTTGTGVGDAVGVLKTAEALDGLEATTAQFKAGKLSPRQAKAVATAAAAAPQAEQELLTTADRAPVTELETKARDVRRAASPETEQQRHARLHRDRYLRTWIDQEDGAGCGQWKLPPAEHARLMASIDADKQRIFRCARAEGRREPDQAYAADALTSLAAHQAGLVDGDSPDRGGEGGEGSSRVERRSARDVKVIVRVDDTALRRGHAADGEVCEIAGIGPVPVSQVIEWIEGDAFKAAITTEGTDVRAVVHLGRRPIALQRTALEWMGMGCCTIRGCTSSARLEIDHTADWADTYRTVVNDLAPVCGHHHDLKTHQGFTFSPVQSDGQRVLIPPDGAQPELFDTG